MNDHSLRWEYNDVNGSVREFEDLLNSSSLDIIYDHSDPPTYLHYSGSGSTRDLLCVASDLCIYSKGRDIKDPGSGHREIIASIVTHGNGYKRLSKDSQKASWNFEKIRLG